MPNYLKIYFQLFNQISGIIQQLQQAQQQSEESYVTHLPPELSGTAPQESPHP